MAVLNHCQHFKSHPLVNNTITGLIVLVVNLNNIILMAGGSLQALTDKSHDAEEHGNQTDYDTGTVLPLPLADHGIMSAT